MAAGITIGNFTIASGATVGVYASLGATVASGFVTLDPPNDGSVVEVQTSAGTGAQFPVTRGIPFQAATEVWLLNTGPNTATLTAKIVELS